MARILNRLLGNEFERLLKRAAKRNATRFLIYWNRGLGDIALGLYAVFDRIGTSVPNAHITVVTRAELEQPFALFDVDRIVVAPGLARGSQETPIEVLERLGIDRGDFDAILERVDPTKWVAGQIGTVTPRLKWKAEYDNLWQKFDLLRGHEICIAAHVNSETGRYYGYVKDWPSDRWRALFTRLETPGMRVVLFGHDRDQRVDSPAVIDLRGQTTFLEMLSIIKNRCAILIAPDSGVLSMAYYLDCAFAITVISLWADPRQGILKQRVASPNPMLRHYPLCGADNKVSRIEVSEVIGIVEAALSSAKNSAHERLHVSTD
jgi:Glycosyltransferase family 9 (heptosyltransferase)